MSVGGRRPRVLVIYKKAALEHYRRKRDKERVQRLLAEGDPEMERLVRARDDHLATLEEARRAARELGVRAVFRNRWNGHDVDGYDLVVTLGGDGTLLWTSHVVGANVPVLAINTAPGASVGYFAAAGKGHVAEALDAALRGELRARQLARMHVEIDATLVTKRVLNDVLFCHPCPAMTSRYDIRIGERGEEQRSSGVWVGPAAGSTAAQRSAGGRVLPLGSKRLQFVVRELYRGDKDGAQSRLDRGLVPPDESLRFRSHMREASLFVDGAHRHHRVDFGSELRMTRSDEPLTILGLRDNARRR